MNQSRFRFIRCEAPKASTAIAEFGKPSSSSTSTAITASSEYIAAAGAATGSIILVDNSNAVSNLSSSTKAISNLRFSRFDDRLLSFSALGDCNLHLTKIFSPIRFSTSKIPLSSAPVCTSWHPSCANVALACDSGTLNLLDVESCSVFRSRPVGNGSIVSADYSGDGSEISVAYAPGAGSYGMIEICDPRSEKSNSITIELPIRPHCLLNLKGDAQVVVVGQDQFRNPRIVWFDKKSPKAPLLSESLQLSSGIAISSYDPDTSLLALSTRGSNSLLIFDLSRSDRLNHLSTYSSPSAFQAMASRPRRCLDVSGFEIARLCQLTTSSIETLSLTVPRKSTQFSADLFPDAASTEPSLSFDDYVQGKNASPNVTSLDNQQAPSGGNAENVKDQARPSVTEALASIDGKKSANRLKIESRLRKSLVAHVSGQETRSLDSFWYGLKPSEVSMPLGRNILLNGKFLFVPWKSLGASSVAVLRTDRIGRVDTQAVPLLRAHGQQMTCFAVSDLDPGLLVTGCCDSHVRVWRFDANRFDANQPDVTEPDIDLLTPGKVTFIATNPVSGAVVAVASQAPSSSIVNFYDITSKDSSSQPRLCIDCHPEPITSLSFSDDGNFVASSSKDRICRVFDPRASTQRPLAQFEISEGVRDTYMVWIGLSGCLLTIGFGNASSRQISVWSVLDSEQRALEGGAQLLATHVIDQSITTMVPQYDHDLGLLYIAGVGDRTILFFGIDVTKNGSEVIEPLGRSMCSNLVAGIAFLPKTMCNVANVEIGSALYLTDDQVRPISFTVPRKRKEYFQDDLFPDTFVVSEGMTAEDWFKGKKHRLPVVSLQPKGMERLSNAPPEAITEHQLKRLEFLNAERQQEAQPSVEEHIQKQLSNVETAAVVTNRWDAQPIQDKAVAEEEWD